MKAIALAVLLLVPAWAQAMSAPPANPPTLWFPDEFEGPQPKGCETVQIGGKNYIVCTGERDQ